MSKWYTKTIGFYQITKGHRRFIVFRTCLHTIPIPILTYINLYRIEKYNIIYFSMHNALECTSFQEIAIATLPVI